MSEGFWERKLAKERQQHPQPVVPLDKPWWQTTSGTPVQQQTPQQQQQQGTQKVNLTDEIQVELVNGEYRPKKASHLRGDASDSCPDCGGDNYYRPTPSTAKKCWECGYIDGRNMADVNRPMYATTDAPAQQARQIKRMNVVDNTGRVIGTTSAAAGAQPNYHEISTANEATAYISGV